MSEHTPGPWVWLGEPGDSALMAGKAEVLDWDQDEGMMPGGFGSEESLANMRLIAAAPEHALVLRSIAAGLIRWEPFARTINSHGELCGFGLRYGTSLDEFGCPKLTPLLRSEIAKAEGK